MSEIPSTIGDEVNKQLKEVQARATSYELPIEEWTAEDQAALERELPRIKFNPMFVDPGFSEIKKITLSSGAEVQVLDVINFPMILGAVDKALHDQSPAPDSPFEKMLTAIIADPARRYTEIFKELRDEYPAAYKKVILIDARRPKGAETPEQEKQEAYEQSQTYCAAAQIAKTLDKEYKLAFLTHT